MGKKLPSITIDRVHDVRAIEDGTRIELDVTVASGDRKRVLLSFDKGAAAFCISR